MASRGSILDDGYSTGIAAKVSGINLRTVQRWIDAGIVTPSIARGIGKGHWDRFSFADLVALRAVGKLKTGGMSLAKIRKALEALAGLKKGSHLAGMYLASDGRDIMLADEESVTSLLERPGQLTFGWKIPLADIRQEVRAALKEAA